VAVLFVFNVDIAIWRGRSRKRGPAYKAACHSSADQCPFDFEKHFLLRQSARLHSRGLECAWAPAIKLSNSDRNLMFTHRSLDAFVC